MNFCKYCDVLGIPNQGIHSYRVFDIAIVDVIFTIMGAYVISRIYKVSFLWSCIILFSLGIILHRIFCVGTTLDKMIFSG